MTEQLRYRPSPGSDLQFYQQVTNPAWGDQSEINPSLGEILKDRHRSFKKDIEKYRMTVDEKEKEELRNNLWAHLNYYTRDMRLSNLNNKEFRYCVYYCDLCADLLIEDMIGPFTVALSRVASVLELAQSKGGFFRNQMNTFTQRSITSEEEVPKRSLFGFQSKKKVVQ